MRYAYVGCRTTKARRARGEGLSVYEIQPSGDWKLKQCLFVEDNPSYQCVTSDGRFLYSVHGDLTLVSSYRILDDGTLAHMNTLDIGGKNPVDITLDAGERRVIVAALQGGTLYSIDRRDDGSLGKIAARFTYEGKEAGGVSAIHQCLWDRKREYLFACAQGRVTGYGQIRALKYDPLSGQFAETSRFMARTWDEPRHAAMHPNNRWLYMCEEKGNKVLFFRFDAAAGTLTPLQELSTLPETVTAYSDASEIQLDPSGNHVLVSNRYTDLMSVNREEQQTGYLRPASFSPCLGKTPRFFCFAPNGLCYVAHEDSDTIAEFRFDAEAGFLRHTGRMIQTGSPVCVSFL